MSWQVLIGGVVGCVIGTWAYVYGQTKERSRCVSIAVDQMGRVHTKDEYAVADAIAAQISSPNGGEAPK